MQAAVALENIGPGAKKALPALEKAAKDDSDDRVRGYAKRAIRAIQGK